jgi:uncharacterized protein (TIGR00288 family)
MQQESRERQDETRPDVDETHQAALLIDFDNVTMGIRSNLGQELRTLLNSDVIRGKVAVQRAYADWRRYPQYIAPLSEASIDLIFAPAYGSSKKNATDIRLAIDALELVFVRPEIRTFILMSGDSDFSSLVLKLKEYGKYVIGVGIQESSSDLLVQNCDEYYSYSALSGLSKAGEQQLESHDPWVLVGKAVEKMVERGDTMRSDRLKQVMLEIDPSFNEKEQGFSKFNRFVVEAASKGLLSIQKMENGQYGVAPARGGGEAAREEKPEKREAKPRRSGNQRSRERARGREEARRPEQAQGQKQARGREQDRRREQTRASGGGQTRRARPKLTMKSALELMEQVLNSLLEGGAESVRDSDVKRKLLQLDGGFDEGELGYSKFSKFLQAAEEEGAVVLTRGPNGNYQVGLPKAKRGPKRKAPAREAPESAGATTMKRLARFLFGAKQEEPEAKEPTAKAPEARKQETRARPAERSRRPQTTAATPGKGRRGPRDRAAERPAAAKGKSASPGSGRTPRGEAGETRGGRERRAEPRTTAGGRKGERATTARPERPAGRPERPAARPEPLSVEPPAEPVMEVPVAELETLAVAEIDLVSGEGAPQGERKSAEAKKEETKPASTVSAPMPGAPRGTIRGRWGSRGRYRPAQAPPPIFEGQSSPRRGREPTADAVSGGEPGGSATDEGARSIVSRLKRYPGVGGRTAETLVEAFGTDLFRILDQEPDRVRALLPDHRAERVLEARRKELEAGGE